MRNGPTVAAPLLCNIAATTETTWECEAPLETGYRVVSAYQGARTATFGIAVGAFTAPIPDDPNPNVPHGEWAHFSGTVEFPGGPGAWVEVSMPGLSTSCTDTTIGAGGEWECSIDLPGAGALGGNYDVYITQYDLGEMASPTTEITLFYLLPPPPTFQITSPTEEQIFDWTPEGIVVSGTTPMPDHIYVWLDGEYPFCDVAPPSISWSCGPVPIDLGTHFLTAQQDGMPDADVNIEIVLGPPETDETSYAVPEGTTVATFSGTAYPGADVWAAIEVSDSETRECSTTAMTDGTWWCDIPVDDLADGEYNVSFWQEVEGGESAATWRTLTIEPAAAPAVNIAFPFNGEWIAWQSGPHVYVEGTAPGSDPVYVYLDDDLVTAVCMATPDESGLWTCPGDIFADPGHRTLTAMQAGATPAVTEFEVVLPQPGLSGTWVFTPGTTDATVQGTVGIPAWTHVSVHENWGEGWGPEIVGADCPMGPAETFTCVVDVSGVPEGQYYLLATHFFPDDPDVQGNSAMAYVVIGIDVGPVTLDCAYAPAQITISPSGPAYIGVYTLVPLTDDSGWHLVDRGACSGNAGYWDDSVPSWADTPYGGSGESGGECDSGCTLSGLAPGIYEVYYSDASEYYSSFEYLFRIPETPLENPVASTTDSVLLSGTATAGDAIRIEGDGGSVLCTTTVTGSGAWACAFPKSDAATARTVAVDPQSGGMSAATAFRSIPVAPPPPPPTPETPATPAAPTLPTLPQQPIALIQWLLSFSGDFSNLKPGDTFTLNVSEMPEGTAIEVWIHSTPRLLGTATGTGLPMMLELTVPEDIENGEHEIRMTAVTPLGTEYFFSSPATVTGGVDPVEEPAEEPEEEEPAGEGGAGGSGGAGNRADPAAPSALTDSIATIDRIVANPIVLAIAGGLALAILFLVALPTELLNSSLSSNTSRLGRWYGAVDGALTKAQDWFTRVTHSRALAAGLLTVVVAIIYGFVDPNFGFDLVSLRLVLSLGIAFFLLSYGASWVSSLIIRRLWGASSVIELQPTIILFAIVGVIVARLLDFSPGFLVGIAIGLELVSASRRVAARAVLVQFLVVVGLALAAWIAYSLFTPGDDFGGMLVDDTLAAITAEGLTGAIVAVFPLQFLDGRELWLESKRLWVLAFLLVAVPFALLVLPTAVEGTEVGDYGVWLLVFAVFAAVTLAIWFVFARAARREKAVEAVESEHADA